MSDSWIGEFQRLTRAEETMPAKLSKALWHTRAWIQIHDLDHRIDDVQITVLIGRDDWMSFMRDLDAAQMVDMHVRHEREKSYRYEDATLLRCDDIEGFRIMMNTGLYEPPPR